MGKIYIAPNGGGGVLDAENLTATPAQVLKGYVAGVKDSDEPQPGEMEVNSLLSFSVAAYSGRRVLAKWQNPKAAKGKPYSGVYIRYSTSGYPGKTGGTQIYKGAGNNTTSEGQSQAYIDLPNLNAKYYLSCCPYVTCSAGEMTGNVINAEVMTSGQLNVTFTGTQAYTIPAGYTMADVFCVGGGGGYTSTRKGISVSPGATVAVSVGSAGSNSSFGSYCSAGGGGHAGDLSTGANGGSGGGGRGNKGDIGTPGTNSGNGGSNGSNGANASTNGGNGQGSTTRAFGEASGTLYAGGGASGQGGGLFTYDGNSYWLFYGAGSGGAGGGGGGGGRGGANTGGGGGGANRGWDQAYWPTPGQPGQGGSGVVLLRLY